MWAKIAAAWARRTPIAVRLPFLALAQRLRPRRSPPCVERSSKPWPRPWGQPLVISVQPDGQDASPSTVLDAAPVLMARAWMHEGSWQARLEGGRPPSSGTPATHGLAERYLNTENRVAQLPRSLLAPTGAVLAIGSTGAAPQTRELVRQLGYTLVEISQRVNGLSRDEVQGWFPRVSVLVVTHNQWSLTQLCLEALSAYTTYPNWEVVVVDNASGDSTPELLHQWTELMPNVKVLYNRDNRGFPAACNQAAKHSSGEILCVLNNDTVVTPGWLSALVDELIRNPRVGLVGPTSQGVANEARVKAPYRSLEELPLWSLARAQKHFRRSKKMPMLALFCAATWRRIWDEVGGLDEDFGIGLFEDDDFSYRLRERGYELRCRLDAFVHHFQSSSFSRLGDRAYWDLYERNRRLFWAKLRARRRTR